MGRDKAFLPITEGGEPMIALVLERLRGVADDVSIVANDAERYGRFGVRVVPDVLTEIGALGGIHAAVSHAANERCLVVACDMPFLNDALLSRMANEPRDYDVLIPVISGESRQGRQDGVLQTLHAIYSKQCLPAIEAQIRHGNRRVIGFFDEVRVRTLEQSELERWDPELRSFFNANTPETLALASDLARGGEPSAGVRRSPIGHESREGSLNEDGSR